MEIALHEHWYDNDPAKSIQALLLNILLYFKEFQGLRFR